MSPAKTKAIWLPKLKFPIIMRIRIALSIVALCIVLFAATSCGESDVDKPCELCVAEADSTFTGAYFRLMLGAGDLPILVRNDSSSDEDTPYFLCNGSLVDTLEQTKILRVDGSLKKSCDDAEKTLLEISEFSVVEYCFPEIPLVEDVDFTLYEPWSVNYVQVNEMIVYPPCEGFTSLTFDPEDGYYYGAASESAFAGPFSFLSDSTIQIYDYAITLSVGTESEMAFERHFFDVFERNATLTYHIENNFLMIENPSKNSFIKFFTTR